MTFTLIKEQLFSLSFRISEYHYVQDLGAVPHEHMSSLWILPVPVLSILQRCYVTIQSCSQDNTNCDVINVIGVLFSGESVMTWVDITMGFCDALYYYTIHSMKYMDGFVMLYFVVVISFSRSLVNYLPLFFRVASLAPCNYPCTIAIVLKGVGLYNGLWPLLLAWINLNHDMDK